MFPKTVVKYQLEKMSITLQQSVLPELQKTIEKLVCEFDRISEARKPILQELTNFVDQKVKANETVLLNFICTHNSRRSHISQIWAQAAAHYYGVKNVQCFSGGTEATAFNPRAVNAMVDAGFEITATTEGQNPVYHIKYSNEMPSLIVFSKKYDDAFNPKKDFAAVMTCSHADENCPLVSGATKRIPLTYNDPKDFDGTPQESEKYSERVQEIGREILFAFSRLK
jgi:arsenate reductase (thioredoxin)